MRKLRFGGQQIVVILKQAEAEVQVRDPIRRHEINVQYSTCG